MSNRIRLRTIGLVCGTALLFLALPTHAGNKTNLVVRTESETLPDTKLSTYVKIIREQGRAEDEIVSGESTSL